MGDENLGSVLIAAIVHVLRVLFWHGTDTGPASWTARVGGWILERLSFERFTYDRNRAVHVVPSLILGVIVIASIGVVIAKLFATVVK
jgi:hypothetical protein